MTSHFMSHDITSRIASHHIISRIASHHRTQLTKFVLTVCGALALMAVGGIVVWAAVDNTTETEAEKIPRTIHYEGYLELNGRPLNAEEGEIEMQFTLNSPNVPGEDINTTLTPSVNAGHFVVDLPTKPWVFEQASSVYVSIRVDGVPLEGKQQIMSVPFAVRAAEAVDFKVKKKMEYIGMIPKGTVITVNLSSEDRNQFDNTGLGKVGSPYEGWAICNGKNNYCSHYK